MKSNRKFSIILISVLGLVAIMMFMSNMQREEENPDLAGAEFLVSWYDVGEDVLDGLNGIELVNSGYHGSTETNAVLYNPALISVGQIEKALKDTGIYLGTLKWNTGYGIVPVWKISVDRHPAVGPVRWKKGARSFRGKGSGLLMHQTFIDHMLPQLPIGF